MYSSTVAVETHCQPMTGDRQPYWAYKYLNPKTIVITLITLLMLMRAFWVSQLALSELVYIMTQMSRDTLSVPVSTPWQAEDSHNGLISNVICKQFWHLMIMKSTNN